LAFSFEVIKFYLKMNSSHKVPVQAFITALTGSLDDRGYQSDVSNPYYQQFQNCCHWFDGLLCKIEVMIGIHIESVAEPVSYHLAINVPYSPTHRNTLMHWHLTLLTCMTAEPSRLVEPAAISESDVQVALGGRDGEEIQRSESPAPLLVEIGSNQHYLADFPML
jgi:hypothetical protein